MENKKSKKGLVLAIIAIIIIAIVAGVVYYFLGRPVSPRDLFISRINASIDEVNSASFNDSKTINSTITLSRKYRNHKWRA